VYHADDDRTDAYPAFLMIVAVKIADGMGSVGFMLVRVKVSVRAMLVRVHVDLAALDDPAKCIDTEYDQHQSYAKLKRLFDAMADLEMKCQNDDRGGKKRDRVTDAPKAADNGRAPRAFPLGDDGGNRGKMVCLNRMFQAESETERQQCKG
jgi:hypothetical protein